MAYPQHCRIAYNAYVKKCMREGREPIDMAKWMLINCPEAKESAKKTSDKIWA